MTRHRLSAEGERPGAKRTAVTANGDEQAERLLDFQPDQRRYRYEMLSTALPIRNYVAEFHVRGADVGASVGDWSAEFDVTSGSETDAVKQVRDFLQAGLDNIQKRYS
jgi:mxaD protein